ncbi:MAG: UbiA family prenyltransferase [Phycisphaerales bacterium]|nr:UbiA family prenyltransferase [Phycisphaerales bacterium]
MNIRAWLELMRLSNAPTIVSNVLVGWAIGLAAGGDGAWSGAALTALAMLLLYIGGMAFNDVMDVEIDRRQRPSRPIPSGRVTRSAAAMFVMACFLAALGILATQDLMALAWGFVLMIAIVLYDIIHARTVVSVALMGLCRGLVYVTAAIAAGWSPQWSEPLLLPVALMTYVLSFSLVARSEAGSDRVKFESIIVLLPMCSVVFGEFVSSSAPAWLTILGRAAFLIWTLGVAMYVQQPQRNVGRAVAGWIAGIALLDLYHLTRLDQPEAALAAGACFLLTLIGQKWIAGT